MAGHQMDFISFNCNEVIENGESKEYDINMSATLIQMIAYKHLFCVSKSSTWCDCILETKRISTHLNVSFYK